MLNLFVVNFIMAYLMIAGFFFACASIVLNNRGQKMSADVITNCLLWPLVCTQRILAIVKMKAHGKCVAKSVKDGAIVKQIGFRRGKPMLVKSDLIGLVPGDRVIQFHHDAWSHGFKVIEGIVEKDGVIWVTGHIEPVMSELNACVMGWSKLSPPVQTYLTTKS